MKIPVLLPNIFDHPFTYNSNINLSEGDYVIVPFGKKNLMGVVWNEFEKTNDKIYKIRSIYKKVNYNPLNKHTLKFINWFSKYNLIPKGMSLKLHMPNINLADDNNNFNYDIFYQNLEKNNFTLSNEQTKALNEVLKKNNNFNVHLIQGATGSGKTLVYFKAIQEKIKKNKQALILLPEIGLTSEFEKKFIEFFGFKPAIWHSKITKKQKKIIWNGLNCGKIKAVIGARSALFLPFKKLGLIVVDEEHDQSFKQDDGIIYNARDMAIARAKFENIPINLVTAVPSLETYANIKNEKYSYSRILNRYKNAQLPTFEIINLNKNKPPKKSWISPKTLDMVKNHLEKGDQVLFFLNRRGFAPFVLCKNCLNKFSCPNCSINLVYHKKKNILLCHYCGYKSSTNRKCIENDKCDLAFTGPGVERVYEEVNKNLPNFKSIIFSSDTMNKKNSKNILKKIVNNEINILVGTQLISKGFHFPNLNCIVVLDIDLSSSGYDLRGAEKNLQLYHQLSGRAGRAGKPAKIYFQTYTLNSESINQITNEDPFNFLKREIKLREKNNLPPFERFISIIISSNNEKNLYRESIKLKLFLDKKLKAKILGPVNSPIYKIRGKYRNRILIRSVKSYKVQDFLSSALKEIKLLPGIKLTVDVDPINFN